MAKAKAIGSIKRFGARYGKTTKQRYAKLEHSQKSKYKCPSCHYPTVGRVNLGVWECRKCGLKFAGKAYTLGNKVVKAAAEE
jgi:large subunit ribosomal protein L37Ae